MSATTKTSWIRRRSRPGAGALLVGAVFAGSMLIGSTSLRGSPASEAAPIAASSPAQAATCVEATNSAHATAGRALQIIIFVWARGSFDYLGTSWETTSLQEGPTGTWTSVESCGGGEPDGEAIYQANCAGCHGAEGEGGRGPSLQGIGEVHTVDELVEVITNGRGAMPAWQGRLTPEEIQAVGTYVSTIPGEHEHEHPTTTTTVPGTTTTTRPGTTTTTAPGTTTTTAPGTTTTTVHEHDHEHEH